MTELIINLDEFRTRVTFNNLLLAFHIHIVLFKRTKSNLLTKDENIRNLISAMSSKIMSKYKNIEFLNSETTLYTYNIHL